MTIKCRFSLILNLQNPKMNEFTQQLKVSFDKNITKDYFTTVEKRYSELPLSIYQSAIHDGDYIGSDIWEFFQK